MENFTDISKRQGFINFYQRLERTKREDPVGFEQEVILVLKKEIAKVVRGTVLFEEFSACQKLQDYYEFIARNKIQLNIDVSREALSNYLLRSDDAIDVPREQLLIE